MYYISEEDKLKIIKLIEDLLLKQYWLGIETLLIILVKIYLIEVK